MLRYCINCKEDFDFAPTAVSGKADLICPKCQCIIPKNSRKPVNNDVPTAEDTLGGAFAGLLHIAYMFYITLSIIGIIAFFLKSDLLLYTCTLIALIAYIIQFLTGTTAFTLGIAFIPAGAIAGYLILQSPQGAALGILIVFCIRHLIRDFFFYLIEKLISLGNK